MKTLDTMRCIVLGGGGFIGTNLCLRLAGRVRSLKAFGRRQTYPSSLQGIDWFHGDFNDPAAVATAIEGCDTVFHLVNATTPASANVDKIADLRSNVSSTLHLLEACRIENVKRVIFVSSGGTIYGVPEHVPTPETASTWPITAYGISKLAVERYLHLFEYLHQLDYRVLRVSNPFGPFQNAAKNQGVIAAFFRQALARRPLEVWGDGTVGRDYLYIDDLTEALEIAALHEGEGRIFNIGSGVARSLNEVIATMGEVIGEELIVQRSQGRPVDVPVSVLDITLARTALDWVPRTDFVEGLSRTLAWMRRGS